MRQLVLLVALLQVASPASAARASRGRPPGKVPAIRIRPIDPSSSAEIALVAKRMRATLVEVLGPARGNAMHSLAWLRQRVRFHLDPVRRAQVFLAEDADGAYQGHTIVRVDQDRGGRSIGYVSTTWVEPAVRRHGLASRLLERAETWMVANGQTIAVTHTDVGNAKLIGLYQKHGYVLSLAGDDMVALTKSLGPAASSRRTP